MIHDSRDRAAAMALNHAHLHEWHDGPVKGLAATGNLIASGGSDGVVRMMTPSGDHVGSYRHDDLVNSVAVAPDGSVASGSRDRTVRLWDANSQRSYEIGEHDHWVMTAVWSPDGAKLVTGSEDSTVAIWSPADAGVTRIEVGYPVNGLDWRGDTIAAVTGDRRLIVMDQAGIARREVRGATQLLWDVALSPDAERVAWVGRDRYLWLADIDGEPEAVPAHRQQIWSVAWSEDGSRILTASADGTVGVWDRDGTALERVELPVWARRAITVGDAVYVSDESGKVHVFQDDGLPVDPPESPRIPEPPPACSHWAPEFESTSERRCRECGGTEELRLCVTCGYVGCCESQLAHGTKHWEEIGHPNTVPVSDGPPRWRWCYADDIYVKRTIEV